jgi:hypothetical protein
MLDILNKHLEEKPSSCVVNTWINSLKSDEQEAFNLLRQNNQKIKFAILYKELLSEMDLPFKLTVFRSHMRGYCTCQRN